MQTLAKAGELSLRLPKDIKSDKLGRHAAKSRSRGITPCSSEAASERASRAPSRALSIVARNDPSSGAFVEKFTHQHCRSDVSEEWKQVDDGKLDALRGILAALKEENQATQLLKHESADRQAGSELESMRTSVKARLEACKEQESEFEEKKAKLRGCVLKYEKSLRLMETNIEKGDRKAKEELQECRRLDTEIRAVTQDIGEHEGGRREEEAAIARASGHKAFLESVVQECEEDFEGDIKVLMNRYHTLDSEKQSLHARNTALAAQLNRVREESLKVQTELQTEVMMDSSRLHEAQVALEKHRSESKELENRLNRNIEDKELRKSQAAVIQMAIEQIFERILESCRLKQRKDAMLAEIEDRKFAPVRGDKGDVRLDAKLNQIIVRVRDLKDMSDKVRAHLDQEKKKIEGPAMVDEVDILSKVQFVQQRDKDRGGYVPEAGSSQQSSELGVSAGGSMKQASSGASGGVDGSQSPPGLAAGSSSGARRKAAGRKQQQQGASGAGGDPGVSPEVTTKDVAEAFRGK